MDEGGWTGFLNPIRWIPVLILLSLNFFTFGGYGHIKTEDQSNKEQTEAIK